LAPQQLHVPPMSDKYRLLGPRRVSLRFGSHRASGVAWLAAERRDAYLQASQPAGSAHLPAVISAQWPAGPTADPGGSTRPADEHHQR